MTGLEKIINRIQEEADAAAAGRLEAAKAEADRILAEARTVCDSVDAETTEKITAMKASYDSRVASSRNNPESWLFCAPSRRLSRKFWRKLWSG